MATKKTSVEADAPAPPTRGRGRPAGTGLNGQGENKSAFVREFLNLNPMASAKEVAAAWGEKGNSEPLAAGLYYQVRNKMGFARKRRSQTDRKPRTRVAPSATSSLRPTSLGVDAYIQIESTLDQLISQVHDAPLVEALRIARRRVSLEILRGS
jgi:hypothetical protein